MNKKLSAQLNIFVIWSVLIFCLASGSYLADHSFYEPYLGHTNPIWIIPFILSAGFVCLWYLERRSVIAKDRNVENRWVILSFLIGILYGGLLIILDRYVHLPADINYPFPGSVPFYLSLAFMVNISFHIVPFALLYLILSKILKKKPTAIMTVSLLVTMIEPIYQLTLPFLKFYSVSLSIWILLYSIVFNGMQVFVFVRKGFLPMLALRLGQYTLWHIIWGFFRLL